MARIAVIGPGAVGSTVAAWLAQDSAHAVIVCARSPVDHLEVQSPEGVTTAHPQILTAPDEATAVDWILIATKTYDAKAAADWLPGLMGERTKVAVLQNGIEHRERFADVVGPDRLVPAIVDIPAERTAPGRVIQRRSGTIRVPDDAVGSEFAALFSNNPIDVAVTADFAETAWRKLAINSAGAVNALSLLPAGIARDKRVANVMRGLIRECVAVARAEGVNLPDDIAEEVVEGYRSADPASINSLHADRLAGRPTEVDARNGVIVRLAAKHGIPAPLNEMATALLGALNPAAPGLAE